MTVDAPETEISRSFYVKSYINQHAYSNLDSYWLVGYQPAN